MRENFVTQTIGIATKIDSSLFETMNQNDLYIKNRIDASSGKLLLWRELDVSTEVPVSQSASMSATGLTVYDDQYTFLKNHVYRLVFQCRSITTKAGSGYPYLTVTYTHGNTGGGYVLGNQYTPDLGYGPVLVEIYTPKFPADQTGRLAIGFYVQDGGISPGEFPFNIDSSEGAKAYFALYDEGAGYV